MGPHAFSSILFAGEYQDALCRLPRYGVCAGLPIGLQLMGQAWAEADLLAAGAVLEAAVRARVHPPRIYFDLLRP